MAYQVGTNLVEGTAVSPIDGVSTAVSSLIGAFERGPLNVATLVTSFAQFTNIFGAVPATSSTSWYSVKAFFAKTGSGTLWIVRVAHSTAAKATYTFSDRQGAPANTLKIEGASEGTWGNALSVKIENDAILTTTIATNVDAAATSAHLTSVEGLEVGSYVEFDNTTQQEQVTVISIDYSNNTIHWTGGLSFAYTTVNGSAESLEFKLTVYVKNVQVEQWTGLSMNDGVSFFCEKAVVSNYITCTDLKDTDTSYEDQPVAIAATALASGADGLSDVVGTDYVGVQATKTGMYALDNVSDLFRFCCPDPLLTDVDPAVAVLALDQSMLDYANARVTCMYYASVPYGKSVASAVTYAENFAGRQMVFFWPWLKVIENSLPVWLPPSGFVLGAAVEKDYRRGVHKNVGNELLPYAIDLEYHVSRAEGEILNNAGVNTVRKLAPGGIRTYGGRTMSTTTSFRFIHYVELWNFIGRSIEVATQDMPFEIHDDTLWKSVIRRVSDFLSNQQRKRALFDPENPTGPAYAVVMDSTNNPADQVALGIATVSIEYVPVGTAEKFVIELLSQPGGGLNVV